MTRRPATSQLRFPACVAAGPFLFYSGQTGRAPNNKDYCSSYAQPEGREPPCDSDSVLLNRMEAPVGAQAIAIYDRYKALLQRDHGSVNQFLRYHVYQRDKRFFPVFDRIRRHHETAPPASTAVGVGRFEPTDKARLCIDSIALNPAAEKTLGKREVLTGAKSYTAPATFSHVIGAGHFLFLAGQIPIDAKRPGSPLIRNYEDIPEEGRFLQRNRSHEDARNGPIAAQTWFSYDIIREHLEAIGSSMESILNLVVYLQDMRDFPTFHRVHQTFFGASPPALTVIEVSEVGHKGTLIEIEPTAILSRVNSKRKVTNVNGSLPQMHMSPIVQADGLAFLSGVMPVDETGAAIESTAALPAAVRKQVTRTRDVVHLQTHAVLHQLKAVLKAAGRDLRSVAQLTIYLQNIEDLPSVAPLVTKSFGKRLPSGTVIEARRPAPAAGVRVSMTATAWFGDEMPVAH